MKRRVGFIHAHYSNIAYFEQAFSHYEIECVHFVNPTIIQRVNSDANFTLEQAQHKLHEQIESLAFSPVDVIVITCTNYSSIVQEDKLEISIPVMKIDIPFFEYLTSVQSPITIVFSNPATVKGTITSFENYLSTHNTVSDFQVQIIPDCFDLVMQGLTEQYNHLISDYLHSSYDSTRVIAVAQLSMVNGAKRFNKESGNQVIHVLDTLVPAILLKLTIQN